MTESGKEHILSLGMVYSQETIPKRGQEFRDRGRWKICLLYSYYDGIYQELYYYLKTSALLTSYHTVFPFTDRWMSFAVVRVLQDK